MSDEDFGLTLLPLLSFLPNLKHYESNLLPHYLFTKLTGSERTKALKGIYSISFRKPVTDSGRQLQVSSGLRGDRIRRISPKRMLDGNVKSSAAS